MAGIALSGLIALMIPGCTDDSPPIISTTPVWIDPIIAGVGITWTGVSHDCGFLESDCLKDVGFTLKHVECDGCVLGADAEFTKPFAVDTTYYDEGAGIRGIPFGVGPITVTVVVSAGPRFGDHTLTATAVGDRVSGLRTECWTAAADVFPPLGAPCGTTRVPGNNIYIVPIAQTINHGEFYMRDDGLVALDKPASDPLQGFFRMPEVSPSTLRWDFVLISPKAQAPAILVPADDTTTTEVSFRLPLALGDEVTVTAQIPPLAP
jgi:hypothetical protein